MTRRDGAKPRLGPDMSIEDFTSHYWLMAELKEFAKQLGIPARGPKPELSARIERRLRGMPDRPEPRQGLGKSARDSNKPIHRETPVVNYQSDAKTRAFFEEQIGPSFHFTYHLNQFRRHHENLTYGDLVDEWLAERERRRDPGYRPSIAAHGEYNRYIRDFLPTSRTKELRSVTRSPHGMWSKAVVATAHTGHGESKRRCIRKHAPTRRQRESACEPSPTLGWVTSYGRHSTSIWATHGRSSPHGR
jgi:hypothetical protein